MTRHAALHWAFAVMLTVLAAAGSARADTREIQGETLVLNSGMSADTVISTDSTLSGRVRVSLDRNLDCLSATGGGTAIITTSGCSEDAGTLRIDVPPTMPLNITGNGSGDIHLNATHAPVILTMNSSGDVTGSDLGHLVLSVHGNSDVKLGAVQGVVLDLTGSGDVRLASVTGEFILKHHGSGDLAVGHIEAPVVSIESSGSGDMLLGAGSIQTLSAHLQGDGDLAVAAPVHDAEITAYGGGDVKLGAVTGTLNRHSGNGSDIIIGGPAMVDTIIGKVANAISTGEGHTISSGSSSGGHFFHFLLFAIAAFIIWRLIRRRNSIVRPARQPAAAAIHPGVVAITEKLRQVEERLGRVEGYVTSREFDLQQKFKNL